MTDLGYGSASQNRYNDLQAVAPPANSAPQTRLKVRVYIDNVEVPLTASDGSNLSDLTFVSGDRSYANSRFSTWNGMSNDARRSRNDAEVGACSETLAGLRDYARTNGRGAGRIDFEFTTVTGTCNPCKERMERLRTAIKAEFPNAKVRRGERSRVEGRANYSARSGSSVGPGRPQGGVASTSYGFAPGQAELRESAPAVDAGQRGRAAQYYQARVNDRTTTGMVDPQYLPQIPMHPGPARNDRNSPSGSLRTPSPTSSDPANPWTRDEARNAYVSQTPDAKWWAMDPANNKAIRLATFDQKYPNGVPRTAANAQGAGQSSGQGRGAGPR